MLVDQAGRQLGLQIYDDRAGVEGRSQGAKGGRASASVCEHPPWPSGQGESSQVVFGSF
jgi:hypothetical protein